MLCMHNNCEKTEGSSSFISSLLKATSHCVPQAGLILQDPSALASGVSGLKLYITSSPAGHCFTVFPPELRLRGKHICPNSYHIYTNIWRKMGLQTRNLDHWPTLSSFASLNPSPPPFSPFPCLANFLLSPRQFLTSFLWNTGMMDHYNQRTKAHWLLLLLYSNSIYNK